MFVKTQKGRKINLRSPSTECVTNLFHTPADVHHVIYRNLSCKIKSSSESKALPYSVEVSE